MGLAQRRRDYNSLDEFLAWENEQPERHEFFDGLIYAMVGVRRIHAEVTGNCFAALKSALRGTPCRPFMVDLKLQVADDVFYPDVMVTCHAQDLVADMIIRHPTAIIEVLSESTVAYDRGRKFAAYRQIPELQEYALIDPDSRAIEVYRRVANGDWLLAVSEAPRGLVLKSLDFVASVETVFENVEALEQAANRGEFAGSAGA